VPRDGPSWPEPQHGNCVFLMDKETHMTDRDFETDRGSGAIITAFAVLAIIALAALYMLFPVGRDAGGRDVPQAKVTQTAPEKGTTGMSR
jgi:hypothetical protein